MLKCFSFKSSTSSSTIPPNPSQEDTPRTISREYNLAVHTTSYAEIRSNVEAQLHHLNPARDHVQQTLTLFPDTRLTRLASTFFELTETAYDLCLTLRHSLLRARALHAPLDLAPNDAVPSLHRFHTSPNPLPDSHPFSAVRAGLSALKSDLDRRAAKSLSCLRISRRVTCCSAFCVVANAIAAAGGAARVCLFEKRELAKLRQLDAASKCAYVLSNDLGTIDALVSRLHAAVESDKVLVWLGLERGNDRYLVQEVIKQLWKSHKGFLDQVEDLEDHIFLCFYNINKARVLLLQEISSNSA